ncbi:MAG TPA: hypothetical protein VGL37_07870 [Solirubrobacteraceae bacterium]|jgi:hypothetical protein
MSVIVEKQRLIEDVVRLRRAERVSSAREEIAAVRADLEELIGPTATRALAARLLGVSQTALDRWIASGDIPVLLTRVGRREVPLHALLELIEAVRERRLASPEDPRPLGSVLRDRRSMAEGLVTATLLSRTSGRHDIGGHRLAELHSLAYHRAVARRLDEEVLRNARERLSRWYAQAKIDPRYAQLWKQVLTETPSEIARLIGRDTSRMRDLRQSSPFAGTLNEPERRRVLAAVAERYG